MYFTLIFKTIFVYIFITFIYKVVEKKELSINSFIIACLSSLMLVSKNVIIYIVPIISLVLMQMLVNYLSLKSDKIRNIIMGRPIVIIKNGKINFTEMSKLKYSLDDLLKKLRLSGVKSIDKVKYAVLEEDGNLSIFNDNREYPLPLILDGVLDFKVLDEINKDYKWIIDILKKRNLELDEVFYAFFASGKVFIIKKDELL